ncbi:unnamed protein product [Diabrotica balteata]|uniref:Reverse transcriptase domain-containing protein n=1 Tax=Diabrotica balteata TaxID=107213 RepID=A0A9N9XA29_DIABA|nr:unnamed protein product [Diabrotica balteata]
MLQDLQRVSQKVGLEINFAKTKMMTNLVPSGPLKLENWNIETVDKYIYLGHEIQISRDNQTCELSRRIALGWATFGKIKDVFKENIPIKLKRKAFNQYVLPVLTFGAETLTLTKASIKKLQVAQRKMERSMLGVTLSGRRHKTDYEVEVEMVRTRRKTDRQQMDKEDFRMAAKGRQAKSWKTTYQIDGRH